MQSSSSSDGSDYLGYVLVLFRVVSRHDEKREYYSAYVQYLECLQVFQLAAHSPKITDLKRTMLNDKLIEIRHRADKIKEQVDAAERIRPSAVVRCERDPTSSQAWMELGNVVIRGQEVYIGGESFTKQQCLMRAIYLNPRNGAAWNELGTALARDETCKFGDREFSKAECFVKCLSIAPRDHAAWFNLGNNIKPGVVLRVGKAAFTQAECFGLSCRLKPDFAKGWKHLGCALGPESIVTVESRQYTKQQCLQRAVHLELTNGEFWLALSDTVADDGRSTVRVDYCDYTKQQLIARAGQLGASIVQGALVQKKQRKPKYLRSNGNDVDNAVQDHSSNDEGGRGTQRVKFQLPS